VNCRLYDLRVESPTVQADLRIRSRAQFAAFCRDSFGLVATRRAWSLGFRANSCNGRNKHDRRKATAALSLLLAEHMKEFERDAEQRCRLVQPRRENLGRECPRINRINGSDFQRRLTAFPKMPTKPFLIGMVYVFP